MFKLTTILSAVCFAGFLACSGNVSNDSSKRDPKDDSPCTPLEESECLGAAACSTVYGTAQDGSQVFGHCADAQAACDDALACHRDPNTGAEVQFDDLCEFDWAFVSSVCSWGDSGTGGQASTGGQSGTGGQNGLGGTSNTGGAGTGGDVGTGGSGDSDVPPEQVGHVPKSCGAITGGDEDPTIVDCTAEGDEQAICVFSNHCLCSDGFACGAPDGFTGECTHGVVCVPAD